MVVPLLVSYDPARFMVDIARSKDYLLELNIDPINVKVMVLFEESDFFDLLEEIGLTKAMSIYGFEIIKLSKNCCLPQFGLYVLNRASAIKLNLMESYINKFPNIGIIEPEEGTNRVIVHKSIPNAVI